MRVTQSMLSNNTLRQISSSYTKLSQLDKQLYTGKKFTKASDDPVAAMRAMGYRSDLNRIQQYQQNIGEVNNWVDSTDDALNNVNLALQKIRELTVQASNGTLEESQRSYIAEEIKQLKEQIKSVGDTQIGGKYLFGGTKTDVKPSDDFSQATGLIEIEIFNGIKFSVNTEGASLFPDLVGTPASSNITSDTGTSTINVKGTYGDNAVTELKVSYDTASQKWQLDNGTEKVDINGKNATINGITIDLTNAKTDETFTITLDNGQPSPITNPEKSGVLQELINTLENGGSEEEIGTFLSKLDTQINNLLAVRATVGAKQNRVELMEDRLGSQEVFSTRILSDNEDVDMEKAIMALTAQESVHRAAMAVGARIIQPTLMDFLL